MLICEDPAWTRQEILQIALKTFDCHEEYDSMMHLHRTKVKEDELWRKIAELVPLQGDKLNLVLRGLKRWVQLEDGKPVLRSNPDMADEGRRPWSTMMGDVNEEDLLRWVEANWQTVKEEEKIRVSRAKEERREAKRQCL